MSRSAAGGRLQPERTMHDSIAQTKTATRDLRRCAALVGVALACASFTAGQARAELLLKDSFGFAPVTSDGGTRLDANGNVVHVFLHSDLNGLRAEFPNNASA